ncbi:MAG TPA: hypothetical protein VJN90_02635 [Candidatus Acidoferrales bacterium]|nr:hypothetical protein [Candidatus Acidoferrales bacterium]
MNEAFLTHNFDDLKILAGMQNELSAEHQEVWINWLIASKWNPNWRYEPQGKYDKRAAEEILDAIRKKPDGALECISSRW